MESDESMLLASAQKWFERSDQVAHYSSEAAQGPSALEYRVLENLPDAPAKVLDVGCGAGRIAVPLAKRGYQVTGVDISDALLARAQEFAVSAGAAAHFEKVTPTKLPYGGATFDAVLSIKQYCYLPGKQLRRDYLADLIRVLRPGGVLLMTGHIVPSEAEAIAALAQDESHQRASTQFDQLEPLDTFSNGEGFVHWFTREQLADELSSLGHPMVVLEDKSAFQIGVIMKPGLGA